MTSFLVEWGTDEANVERVATVDEFDAVLDRIEGLRDPGGLPFKVDISAEAAEDAWPPQGMQVGLGHPRRARLTWFGEPASGDGYEPDVPPGDGERIDFSYGGIPTEENPAGVRVTPQTAREAAREYIRTGRRPTCVSWNTDTSASVRY